MSFFTPASGLPGGDDFQDASAIFEDAAKAMAPGECVFMEEFTLLDAMSAFEIGEPRLDSGVVLEEETRPRFNPLQPMLPEEICWMMDRALSCEMEWHAGNNLSQTVFTILHVHHLQAINPDMIASGFFSFPDFQRPMELVTVVFRAFVFGVLKCCDLAWRELFKGGVQDGEDWQGEKCDISLLEGIQVRQVISRLDDAIAWLRLSPKSPSEWRDELVVRLQLRRTILELMDTDPFSNPPHYRALIITARDYLGVVRISVPSAQAPSSPAALAFDPYIARRLNSFVPLRVVEMRGVDETWSALNEMLDGWQEVCIMAERRNITTWTIFGDLRLWRNKPAQRVPYIRSLNQTTFFDGVLVLYNHPPQWVVERFFSETIGLAYSTLHAAVEESWDEEDVGPPFVQVERKIVKVITNHVRSLWFNAPRRRRHFMKSLYDWHYLYDALMLLTCDITDTDSPECKLIAHAATTAQLWRLSVLREVVFSGFQLELYYEDEKAFAYYYASVILEAHVELLDGVMVDVPTHLAVYSELAFQRSFLSALHAMSLSMFSVCASKMKFSPAMNVANLFRRYKWAFKPKYDEIDSPMAAPLEIDSFLPACKAILGDTTFSPSGSIKLAKSILLDLTEGRDIGWADCWTGERVQFVRTLADTCGQLEVLPESVTELAAFDASTLVWDPAMNPWFPGIKSSQI